MKPIKELFTKYREQIVYLIFGVLTTAVNYAATWVFYGLLSIHELVSNVLAWAVAVAFAFVTNKLLVFNSTAGGGRLLYEIATFVGARVLTLGIEEVMIYLGVTVWGVNLYLVKLVAAVVVVVTNYVLSKLIIFRKKEEKQQ